ncbi:hypothetical protein ACMYYO_11085 [Dermacoccaceae bacterium W4C1]
MTDRMNVTDRVLRAVVQARVRLQQRPDQGDVPGWVLITLMTAGIVTVLWSVAGPALSNMFKSAIDGVKGPE